MLSRMEVEEQAGENSAAVQVNVRQNLWSFISAGKMEGELQSAVPSQCGLPTFMIGPDVGQAGQVPTPLSPHRRGISFLPVRELEQWPARGIPVDAEILESGYAAINHWDVMNVHTKRSVRVPVGRHAWESMSKDTRSKKWFKLFNIVY